MVGTFIHNFLHGVILFSAFAVSIPVGFATTIAVLLHAIPQNIANLLMNHKNPIFAYIAAFAGIIGALCVYPMHDFLTLYHAQIIATI